MEVSAAVRYIYIYIYVVRLLRLIVPEGSYYDLCSAISHVLQEKVVGTCLLIFYVPSVPREVSKCPCYDLCSEEFSVFQKKSVFRGLPTG